MVSPGEVLGTRVIDAVVAAYGERFRDVDPLLRPSKFADLQCNVPMSLAKQVGAAPRDVASTIMTHLDASDVVASAEVSGPGFINLSVADSWLDTALAAQAEDPQLGVVRQSAQVIPIDYSAPNAAKEMHVGHLRTTVVGDALARILTQLGHTVIRQNHVGDWGTNFGMLVEHLLAEGEDSPEADLLVTEPNAFYQHARAKFEGDAAEPGFADRARARAAALQAGDEESLRIWGHIMDRSRAYFRRIYAKLGVLLTDEDIRGESSYNADLHEICAELERMGLAVVSEGALCVFPEGFTGRDGTPLPLIVRNSAGGFGYATTDLATIRHRALTLGSDRALYVVGATQSLHFQMVWATARAAGWLGDTQPVHVQIGTVVGQDGKMLRTRSGDPMTLEWAVDQAIARGQKVVTELRPDLTSEQHDTIGAAVGVGALKYADLSIAHDSDYTWDLDRMTALTGNTGPYLQYATARMGSILAKAGADADADAAGRAAYGPVRVTEPGEHALALALLGYGEAVRVAGDELAPHKLAGYLFELAQAFTTFYETCPVLKAEPAVRSSRLALVALTRQVLVGGLDLLGIAAPEEM